MRIEDIGGLPVRIDEHSIMATSVRNVIRAVTAALDVERVETDFTHASPGITYHVRDPRVRIKAGHMHGAQVVVKAVDKERTRIERHEAEAEAPRVMDRADAHLAARLGCHAVLRQLERTGLDRSTIHLWSGMSHSFTTDSCSIKISDRDETGEGISAFLSGHRISIARSNGQETWSQGNLVTGRRLQLPDTVVSAMKGRGLDEVVTGTMLGGAGLVIRNAWMNGGRLGLTFIKEDVPLETVIAGTRRLPPAA